MTKAPLTIVVEPEDQDGLRPTEIKIDRAIEALGRGDQQASLHLAQAVVRQTKMAALDGARMYNLLNALQEPEAAAEMMERTLAGIAAAKADVTEDHALAFDCGHTLSELQKVDDAIPVLQNALRLDPSDSRAGMPLLTFLLQDNRPEDAIAAWLPILEASHEQVSNGEKISDALWTVFIRALSYFGFRDHAMDMAGRAREAWQGDVPALERLVTLAQGNDGSMTSTTDAIAQFDAFSEVYDENLSAIGNRGPNLVARALRDLAWEAKATRSILDAGCGTGLCGPILRPFAKVLHGCDLSIGMLKKSKDRQVFDLLTRTDLSNAATYPEGTFDVVVAADVFVYFGDLVPALKNIAAKLKPGGWLIFSVEDASRYAPARGWEKHPSDRFRHMPDYIHTALTSAGFTKPKLQISDTLRHEFGTPVPGLCIATQKLSLVFG